MQLIINCLQYQYPFKFQMNITTLLNKSNQQPENFLLSVLLSDNPSLRVMSIIDTIFSNDASDPQQIFRLRQQIRNVSKHDLFIVNQYYLNQLKTRLNSQNLNDLRFIIENYPEEKLERISAYVNRMYEKHYELLAVFEDNANGKGVFLMKQFCSMTKALLLNELNLEDLFDEYFSILHRKHSKSILDNSMMQYDSETNNYVNEMMSDIKKNFNVMDIKKVMKMVSELDLDTECIDAVNSFITMDIKRFVERFQDSVSQNQPFLTRCEIYYDSFHSSFLKMFEEYFLEQTPIARKKGNEIVLQSSSEASRNKIYLMYGQLVTKNIFSLTLEYPETERFIKELKKCIDKIGMIDRVRIFMQDGIENRLLTPGVVTYNILLQYINMLKVLQVIDSTGEIYDQATTPIKSYLLKRNDTLRCIINHLMGDDKENPIGRLGTQLIRMPSKQIGDMESDWEEQEWSKDLSAEKKFNMIKLQQIDLITVLVNLYGSQESFISEYQIMLAQKLMGAKDYNIDEQVMNLERLKQRFGQPSLQACNIIVKDYKDSRRVDNQINKQARIYPYAALHQKDLHAIIVSKGYWPINYENTTFNMPRFFKDSFESYAEQFAKIKAMRKIHFHYDLGYVNIVLQFQNGDVPFRCLPIHAVIISFFDETKNKEKKVSVEYLMKELDLSQSMVRQKLSYWIHKGVIRPCLSLQSKASISLKRMNSYEQGSAQFYTTVDFYKKPLNSDDIIDQADQVILKQSSFQARVKLAEDQIQKIIYFNGSKTSQQLYLLLKTVYKSEINFEFTEAETKDVLKKMVAKKKLSLNEDRYSCRAKER